MPLSLGIGIGIAEDVYGGGGAGGFVPPYGWIYTGKFNNTNTFYTATVSLGAVSVAGSLFTNANTFFSASAGLSQTVQAGLFSSSNTFYGSVFINDADDVIGSLFTNTNTFYSSTTSVAPRAILGSLFSNANTLYTATTTNRYPILGTLFANTNAFRISALTTGVVNIGGALFTNPNTFNAANIGGAFQPVSRIASSTTANGTGRTSTTITKPTGTLAGHILLTVLWAGNTSQTPVSVTPPAGWNAVTFTPYFVSAADPYAHALLVFWREAGGSEGADYVFTHASATTTGYMVALANADPSIPIVGVTGATGTGNATTNPGVTTTVDGSYLLYAIAAWDGVTGTAPAGYTERIDTVVSYLADGIQTAQGASGAKAVTLTGNSGGPWATVMVGVSALGSLNRTITASLFTNTNTYSTAVIGGGSKTVVGSLFTNTQTFYGSTVGGGGNGAFNRANYPSASNTGITIPVGSLTDWTGSNTMVTNNQTITGRRFNDTVVINPSVTNITFRDCWFNGGFWGIDAEPAGGGGTILVEDCTFVGVALNNPGSTSRTNAGVLTGGGHCIIRRANMSYMDNGVMHGGGQITVTDCFIHTLRSGAFDPHFDCIQTGGGNGPVVCRHNTLISWDTSQFILKTDYTTIANWVIDDNLFMNDTAPGGGTVAYPIYLYSIPPREVQNISIINNWIQKGHNNSYLSTDGTLVNCTASGNKDWTTGANIVMPL